VELEESPSELIANADSMTAAGSLLPVAFDRKSLGTVLDSRITFERRATAAVGVGAYNKPRLDPSSCASLTC
jgi:hypothetical protein